jgi:flagellar hook-length control protein FliK
MMPAGTMPAPVPAPAGASSAADAAVMPHAAPAMPAPDQLGPAFLAAASPAGPSRVVVRLDPAELGLVQVGIVRQPDGPARIELMAERPETLQLLMRDQPALHRALDLAGVPVEGRTLHFQLGAPDAARDPAPAPQPGAAAGGMGGDPSGGGQPRGGSGQAPGRAIPARRRSRACRVPSCPPSGARFARRR